jgi:hypothetical protein
VPLLTELEDLVPKPEYVVDLERRQKFLEDEISRTFPYHPGDELMIGELKRRLLYLTHELDQLHHASARQYLQ